MRLIIFIIMKTIMKINNTIIKKNDDNNEKVAAPVSHWGEDVGGGRQKPRVEHGAHFINVIKTEHTTNIKTDSN